MQARAFRKMKKECQKAALLFVYHLYIPVLL